MKKQTKINLLPNDKNQAIKILCDILIAYPKNHPEVKKIKKQIERRKKCGYRKIKSVKEIR